MRHADSWTRFRVRAGLMVCLLNLSQAVSLSQSSSPALFDRTRLMSDVQTYYGFGVHRTSSPGDRRTSEWLADRFRSLGLQTSTQNWPLRQFILEEASIEDAQGRIHAFP